MARIERMWINQPSTLQPDNKHHGRKVLVLMDDPSAEHSLTTTAYFAEGPVTSMIVFKSSLSPGWPN